MTSPGKQPPTPLGDDQEETARAIADAIWDQTFALPPLERYDVREWWRLVHVRVAALLQEGKGEALSELAQAGHSHREIEEMLRAEGMPLSDSRVGQLVKQAQAAQSQ